MENLTITTIYNNRETQWYTVVENGIPLWKPFSDKTKEDLLNKVLKLFESACAEGDDEPSLQIRTQDQTFHITYFECGSVYLCDELDGRYGSLVPLMDNLWTLLEDSEICEVTLV